MFKEESEWIKNAINLLKLDNASIVLDIGASDLYFRTKIQPHIYSNIYKPLAEKNIKIISCDVKNDIGIDIVSDICEPYNNFFQKINKKFNLVICCNMLEHVIDVDNAIKNVLSVIRDKEGYLLITVPYKYFYHADPIDTMFRPSPDELKKLLKRYCEFDIIKEEIISISERHYYVMPVYPNKILHNIPFFAYRMMWRWLIKKYRFKVTALLVELKNFKI